jgi:type I restriction enzyme M protein
MLIEDHGLQAVIALRAGVLKARMRAAILLVVRGGATRSIWFDELQSVAAIPELLKRWNAREHPQANTALGHGFWVERDAVSAPDYALGIARARAARAARTTAPTPEQLLHEIASLEADILQGIRDLVGLLK